MYDGKINPELCNTDLRAHLVSVGSQRISYEHFEVAIRFATAVVSATVPGEVAVFWLKTVTQVKVFTYVAVVTPLGDLRGKEIWLQRIK